MTIIKEYRITLPITVEEYQVAQLYSVAESSKNETGGGEGVEVKINDPYTADSKYSSNSKGRPGQYTHKLFHLESRVPSFIRMIAPKGSLTIDEKAWNAYPYCKTVITNPGYMKDNFEIELLTWHKPDAGQTENVHELDASTWKKVEIINIDITTPVAVNDYKKETDPLLYRHDDSDRGPLTKTWLTELRQLCKNIQSARELNIESNDAKPQPHMTCYKLVTAKFKWFGLQNRVEKYIHTAEKRIFTLFHRQVFCWMGPHGDGTTGWFGMTMEDIRRIEAETKKRLDEERSKGEKRGHVQAAEES
jgi:hypothetical protein